jgi:SH3-like domain-containing protein
VEEQGEWNKVSAPGGKTGWIHSSALTRKRIVMKAGAENVETAASGQELALANKGFNSDVEAQFKSQNKDLDFTWVDKMAKIKVTPEQAQAFLKAGDVAPKGGGQ